MNTVQAQANAPLNVRHALNQDCTRTRFRTLHTHFHRIHHRALRVLLQNVMIMKVAQPRPNQGFRHRLISPTTPPRPILGPTNNPCDPVFILAISLGYATKPRTTMRESGGSQMYTMRGTYNPGCERRQTDTNEQGTEAQPSMPS